MRVKDGDLLVRLDATQARANLRMIDKQLDELRLRIARLVAERDGLPQVALPRELVPRGDDEEVKSLLASERSLFKARSNALQSQRELLQSRIAQLNEESAGIDAQLQSKVSQLELVARELTGVQDLFDKKLVPLTRLTSLQRESHVSTANAASCCRPGPRSNRRSPKPGCRSCGSTRIFAPMS